MFVFRNNQQLRMWSAASLIGLVLAWVLLPLVSLASELDDPLVEYAQTGDVPLDEATVEGYRQIVATVENEQVVLTDGERNHTQPDVAREYAAWVETINGAGQIVLYHIPTDTSVYLTESGTNQNPQVNEQGHVVWEGWIHDRWQLFYFDGISTRQLTDGDVSVEPSINGNQILFTRQTDTGEWSAHIIDTGTMQMTEVMPGFDGKGAYWQFGAPVFPMKEERERREAEEKAAQEAEAERQRIAEEERLKQQEEEQTQGQDQADAEGAPGVDPSVPTPEDTELTAPVEETEEPTTDTSSTLPITPSEQEDPVTVEETSTEPSVITEEDIIKEIEHEPLVEDSPEELPTPVAETPTEPSPQPEVITPSEQPAPTPEQTPVVDTPPPPAPSESAPSPAPSES